jgi:hypothetical protein
MIPSCTGAAAADADPAVSFAFEHGLRDRLSGIGVVDRRCRMGTQVDDVMAFLRKAAGEDRLELETGVIGGNRETHGLNIRPRYVQSMTTVV